MEKIKINNIEPGNLKPISTNDDYFRTNLYDTPFLVTNDRTLLFTDCLGPCVSLAVFVKDNLGVCHRIVCHCPYAPAVPYYSLEGRIEKYLKSIGKIVELSAMIASFDTFFESKIIDLDYERDLLILNRINNLFSFWKENHPDFEIPIIQSTSLGVNPNGDFLGLSEEAKYDEYIKQKSEFPSSNTILSEKDLNTSIVYERLNQYIQNKSDETKGRKSELAI